MAARYPSRGSTSPSRYSSSRRADLSNSFSHTIRLSPRWEGPVEVRSSQGDTLVQRCRVPVDEMVAAIRPAERELQARGRVLSGNQVKVRHARTREAQGVRE